MARAGINIGNAQQGGAAGIKGAGKWNCLGATAPAPAGLLMNSLGGIAVFGSRQPFIKPFISNLYIPTGGIATTDTKGGRVYRRIIYHTYISAHIDNKNI